MLAPIYKLLFGKHKHYIGVGEYVQSLELTEDQIAISYKTYKSHNPADMQEIVDQKLAAGNQIYLHVHVIFLFIIYKL